MMMRALSLSTLLAGSALAQSVKTGDNIGTLRFGDVRNKIALDQPGVLYVVDFWALGCKPCIQEIPDLERLAAEYEPGGKVRFVGVLWGDWKPKELEKAAKTVKSSRPVFGDPEHWFDRLEIRSFPTRLFIKDGVVVRITRGAGPNTYEHLKSQIESEVNPQPVKWE